MTKVRRTAGAAVLPLVAAAVGIGVGATPADAAICSPLSSASITGPSGTPTAGSTVHASARVSGMLLTAHMQITGPGLDRQVGPSAISGVIEGDVRVPESGVYTLKVMGNGTQCVYDSDTFSVKKRPSTSRPTPHRTAVGAGRETGATRASKAPRRVPDARTKILKPPSGRSPFRLPGVAPDGTGPSVHYPSADPQVAAPPVRQPQPRADNASETLPPIKWGQSIAIALVLLLLSAHMGMWSRRQRLAEAGGRHGRGARKATVNPQVTARLSLGGQHPAEPADDHAPASDAAYAATRQHGGHGPQEHAFAADPYGETHTGSWGDPRSRTETTGEWGQLDAARQDGRPQGHVTTGPDRTDALGEIGTIDWQSWVGARRQMDAADRVSSHTWPETSDREAGVDPGNQADPIGWSAPRVGTVGGSTPDAESDRVGSSDRGRAAVSVGRATRTGRGGYRGRRRRT